MLRRSFSNLQQRSSLSSTPVSSNYSTLPKFKGLDISRATCHPNVVTITLYRPRQKNAITHEMYHGIMKSLNQFSNDPSVGAIVLTGHPDCNMYCSGNDLKNFFAFGSPRTLATEAKNVCRKFVDSFIQCEKPIILGCNGPAIGIAVTTALLCDYRFCTDDTTFTTPFKALAQGPEGCSSYTFPKVLGKELAHKMLDDGYVMKADEAKKTGFVHDIIPRPKLIQHCQWHAADIIEGRIPFKQRDCLAEEELLKKVNFEENEYLEDAWVSEKCFSALEDFMAKKGQKPAAVVFGMLNKTRFLWDKKDNKFKNKDTFIPL